MERPGSLFCDTHESPCVQIIQVSGTVDFQLVVQKLRREFTHAQNFLFKIPAQVRACADSRRDFWTTNWKSTVLKLIRITCTATSSCHSLLIDQQQDSWLLEYWGDLEYLHSKECDLYAQWGQLVQLLLEGGKRRSSSYTIYSPAISDGG